MRRLTFATAVVCFPVCAWGQTTSFKSLSPVGVLVQSNGTSPATISRPANTLVTSSKPLAVTLDHFVGQTRMAHARVKASLRLLDGLPAVRIYEAGSTGALVTPITSRTAGSSSAATKPGPHSFLLRLTDKPRRRHNLQVRFRSVLSGGKVTGVAQVDLGNDKTLEFDEKIDGGGHVKSYPVTVPGSGIVDVRIDLEVLLASSMSTPSSYAAWIDVSVEPVADPTVSVVRYGTTCGPRTTLDTWVAAGRRHVRSTLDQAPKNAPALVAIGYRRIQVPLLHSCFVLTNVRIVLPGRTDANGRMVLNYPTVSSGRIVIANVQHAVADAQNRLLTSDAGEIASRSPSGKSFDFFDINQVLSTGQSLAVGFMGGPAISTTQPFNNKMADGGLCAAPVSSFVPLVEKMVETHHSGLANLITDYAENEVFKGKSSPRNTHEVLTSCHGVPAWEYNRIKKGQPPYALGIKQVASAQSVAKGLSRSHVVRAVTVVHGETDHLLGNGNYEQDLETWQSDYENDIKAITGQAVPVPILHSQFSTWTRYGSSTSAVMGLQLQASVANPRKIVMVGPKYALDYHADGIHLDSGGYRHLGEYYARVYRHVVLEGGTWEPLRPLTATRNADVIDVRFHVPVPPLVLDASIVVDPGKHGFEFWDSSASTPAVKRVEIIDEDTVRITLTRIPTGRTMAIRYAFTGILGNNGGPSTGPRGNLRDSDDSASRHGNKLHNWSVHFGMPVN